MLIVIARRVCLSGTVRLLASWVLQTVEVTIITIADAMKRNEKMLHAIVRRLLRDILGPAMLTKAAVGGGGGTGCL